jgi:diguanylate cyclase (GGDEF)-like protein
MNLMISQPVEAATSHSPAEIQHYLRALERKEWWHWWNTVLVIMLLIGAIVSFSLPNIIDSSDSMSQMELSVAVRGLLGLVLIFNIYMLYQQYLLSVLRKYLTTQIQAAAEQKVRADTLYELAILDPLTGLFNRRFGEDYLRAEIARSERTGASLMVMFLDLDDFKNINDRHGHLAGDLVLQEFAHRLKKAIRGSDIAVRLGGDEFLVVLPECPPEKIELVLSRLMDVQVKLGNENIPVFCSIGWTQYQANDTAEELIRRADAALYADKATLNL